jgi:hypothetical protein
MSTRQLKELNMVKGSASSCSCPHMEANILHNGNKGVVNFIMGSHVFVAMSAT